MMIQAADLLATTKRPTEAQIRTAMNGHLCRCGTYPRILTAIQKAAAVMAKGGKCHDRDPEARSSRASRSSRAAARWSSASALARRGLAGRAQAADSPFASNAPYDPNSIDSWITIHADNTVDGQVGPGRARPGHLDTAC